MREIQIHISEVPLELHLEYVPVLKGLDASCTADKVSQSFFTVEECFSGEQGAPTIRVKEAYMPSVPVREGQCDFMIGCLLAAHRRIISESDNLVPVETSKLTNDFDESWRVNGRIR
jgi:hypothetical protein